MDDKPFESLNMIPFVDIMLVLLTIVLTTSSFIASGRIPIALPKASASKLQASETRTIEIDATGTVYLDAKAVTPHALEAKLASMDRSGPLLLRADRSVPLQRFIDVADILNRLGFSSVSVQTLAGGS